MAGCATYTPALPIKTTSGHDNSKCANARNLERQMTLTPALFAIPSTTRERQPRPPAPNFDDRPDGSLIRAADLVRNPKTPNRPSVLDISLSTLWRYVEAGTFPQPVRLSAGLVAWKVGDVRAWIDKHHSAVQALAA